LGRLGPSRFACLRRAPSAPMPKHAPEPDMQIFTNNSIPVHVPSSQTKLPRNSDLTENQYLQYFKAERLNLKI